MEITALSGAKSESFTIDIVLENSCPTAQLSLTDSPFIDLTYVLQTPEVSQSWGDNQGLYTIDTEIDCGPANVHFFYLDATDLNEEMFFVGDDFLCVEWSDDIALKGEYEILYKVSLELYPDNFVNSVESFKVTVEDPCDNPISIEPVELET